jgi:hypothetical protein
MPIQSAKGQADTREFVVYTDQHGREWEGWGDIKAKLHPTSTLRPLFDAPWVPDQRYMTFSQRKPGEFEINYDAILGEIRRAHEARRDHVLKVADHFNVAGFDPDTDEPTAQMKRELGEAPLPIDPVLAAKAGNGFILGSRPFDANRPADVKLKTALAFYQVKRRVVDEGTEFADQEFADEPVKPVKAPKGKQGGITAAERAKLAQIAEVSEEAWAHS